MTRPFRWKLERRESLGSLVCGDPAPTYPGFLCQLRECAAKVLASSHDSDMIFIGRSPESIYDYLCGVLCDSSWRRRLFLVNLSLRGNSISEIRRHHVGAIEAARAHLAELGLTPRAISAWPRPLSIVDLVCSGSSFGLLLQFLNDWALCEGIDAKAVRRRLRILGITWRTRPSPNTNRWHQHQLWTKQLKRSQLRNISIPGELWDYLGNYQYKVTLSNPPWRWADPNLERPLRKWRQLKALRLAFTIHRTATQKAQRIHFIEELLRSSSMREPWYRQLVQELRFGSVAHRDDRLLQR